VRQYDKPCNHATSCNLSAQGLGAHFPRPLREVGILISCPQETRRLPPSLRVLCARSELVEGVGSTHAYSIVFEVDVAFDVARVERILLSVAFDAAFDVD